MIRRGESRRSRALGQGMRALDQPHDRLLDLGIAHEHEVVEMLAQDGLWQREARAGGEPFRDAILK